MTVDDDLYRATADDPAAARLLGMIERIDDRIATLDAEEAAAGVEEPDVDLQAILAGLCRPDDAPLEWRSIGGRVERGTLTWQRFWAHPREEGPAGTALVAAALTASTSGLLERFRDQEATLLEQIDQAQRGDVGGLDPQRPDAGGTGAAGRPGPAGPFRDGRPGGAGGR